jgi:hypothetical protein
MDSDGYSGAVGNFNWIRFTLEGSQSTASSDTPMVLPGAVEAEHFDNGGAGVAYFDLSPENSGGAYRVTDVDLQPTIDSGGGYDVGWAGEGEWLNYSVNVAAVRPIVKTSVMLSMSLSGSTGLAM